MRLSNATTTLQLIPDGVPGLRETLALYADMVREYAKNITIRQTAAELVAECPPKNWRCEVNKIFAFVRDDVRYIQDPVNVELAQTPLYTLQRRYGDCGQKSMLLGALLRSIGHPVRFMAIGLEPGVFCHVYLQTKIGPDWVGLDATEPVAVGWEPRDGVRARLPYFI